MKKLLLAFVVLAAQLSAMAQTVEFPTLKNADSYDDKYAPIVAPVTIGQDGTLYQTGLYDQAVTIGEDNLTNVGTSAFLAAVNPTTNTAKWAVGLQGNVKVTAVATNSEALFVTGVFSKAMILGSKDGTTKPLVGLTVGDYVNAFIAKYDLQGNLIAAEAIIPHPIPAYGDYDSDCLVYPTSIAPLGDKVFVAENFLGGYTVGELTNEGTVKSAFGYYDSKCVSVLSFSAADLSSPALALDMRNAEAVNENGLCPSSICITTDGTQIYAAIFASGKNTLTVNGEASTVEFTMGENSEYGAVLATFGAQDSGTANLYRSPVTERIYINNTIRSMQVADGKLYIAGHVSSALPFDNTLIPDLWSDQFATCISLDTKASLWSSITGAKRDNMSTMNEKYRESIASALDVTAFKVIGSTNFSCNDKGQAKGFTSDACLGIAAANGISALTTKTSAGSKLTITGTSTSVKSLNAQRSTLNVNYDLNGRIISNPSKGTVYIQSGKKYRAK